jgi:lipopolysaccharide/colanic/teichoic acid biosynthesis glycosyltransferase
MKRIFDIVCSVIILVLFFPFGLIISILILLESKGGVFYRQERIGRFGKPFKLFKFRSMRKDADKSGKLTVGMKDSRITKTGYFIRKFKLDEFPQFINVILGDMSIVGPRPEVKEYVDLYTDEQRKILNVRPGITDLASLEYFKENELLGKSDNPQKTYIEEIMPAKIELNKQYLSNPTLSNDLKIMWKTFVRIIR